MYRYFKRTGNTDHVLSWKFKGLSEEIIKPPATSDNILAPALSYIGNKPRVKFDGICLKQDKITLTHEKAVNLYILYKINLWNYLDSIDPRLGNSIFGVVKLVKNVDIDKYKYSGYGTGFDMKETFTFPTGGLGKNVIIFGVDMSSSVHEDNKKKDILLFGEGPAQGLDDTILTAEKSIHLISLSSERNFV